MQGLSVRGEGRFFAHSGLCWPSFASHIIGKITRHDLVLPQQLPLGSDWVCTYVCVCVKFITKRNMGLRKQGYRHLTLRL